MWFGWRTTISGRILVLGRAVRPSRGGRSSGERGQMDMHDKESRGEWFYRLDDDSTLVV